MVGAPHNTALVPDASPTVVFFSTVATEVDVPQLQTVDVRHAIDACAATNEVPNTASSAVANLPLVRAIRRRLANLYPALPEHSTGSDPCTALNYRHSRRYPIYVMRARLAGSIR